MLWFRRNIDLQDFISFSCSKNSHQSNVKANNELVDFIPVITVIYHKNFTETNQSNIHTSNRRDIKTVILRVNKSNDFNRGSQTFFFRKPISKFSVDSQNSSLITCEPPFVSRQCRPRSSLPGQLI